MAKFTSVLDEREDRIVFEKEDGSEFTSPRSPEANKLAAALPRKPTPTPPKVARGADPADVQQEPYSGDSRSAGPQQDPEVTPASKVWEQYGSASKDDMSYDVDRPEASPQFASDTRQAPQPTLYAEPSMPEPERVTQAMGTANLNLSPLVTEKRADASSAIPFQGGDNLPAGAKYAPQKQVYMGTAEQSFSNPFGSQGELPAGARYQQPTPTTATAPEPAAAEAPVADMPTRPMTREEQFLAQERANLLKGKYVPGSPAVTVADLERQAANKRMNAKTMQEQRTYDQAPVSPELQGELAAINLEKRGLNDVRAQSEEALLERQQREALQANKAAQGEAIMQRALEKRAIERTQQRLAQVEELDSKIANWSEDPNRVFGGNALSQIGAIIAQAIGAYSAALGGGPNQAMQLINGVIDRDIAAQRAEYGKLKDARVNAYGWYVEQLGDEDLATAALKASQMKIVQAYDASVVASDKRKEVQLAWADRDLQYREEAVKQRQEIANIEQGKVVKAAAGTADSPRAATRGGYVRPTLKQFIEGMSNLNKAQDQLRMADGGLSREAEEKIAIKRAELILEAKHAGVKDETLTKFNDDLNNITKAREATRELRSLVDKYKDSWDIPGHGFSDKLARAAVRFLPGFDSDNPASVMSQQGEDLHNAANRLLSSYVFSVSGAAATDKEREFLRKALFGNTDKSLLRGLEYMENQLANRMIDLEAVYAETGAPQAYVRNIQEAARRHNPNNDPKVGVGNQALNMIVDITKQADKAAAPAQTRKHGLQR
jgi:hypothetical protein